jgi:hypothetical protein
MTPHAYQLQIRVRRAKTLLLAGTPIAQAAGEAGFWDQAHLTRHFKRTIGVTPARYIAGLANSQGGRACGGSGVATQGAIPWAAARSRLVWPVCLACRVGTCGLNVETLHSVETFYS